MTRKKFRIGRYAKSIVGFLAPFLTQMQQALDGGVSLRESARALLSSLITALVVWAVPNSQT